MRGAVESPSQEGRRARNGEGIAPFFTSSCTRHKPLRFFAFQTRTGVLSATDFRPRVDHSGCISGLRLRAGKSISRLGPSVDERATRSGRAQSLSSSRTPLAEG